MAMTTDRQSGAPRASYHDKPVEAVLAALDSRREGLSEAEAEGRIARHGFNRLPSAPRRTMWARIRDQFNNLLIFVLLGSAAVSVGLGHLVDAGVILAVVVINAVIGIIQEGRAEHSLEAIRSLIDPRASVLRDGRRKSVAAETIVPGDIVLIEAGDRVPADLRLIKASSLRIDEAVLTGESVPAEKSVAAVAADAALGDRLSLAYSGAFVTTGQGVGVAVATGVATEIGRIGAMLGGGGDLKTPLIRQMDRFAGVLTLVILVVSALALAFAWGLRGYAFGDAMMAVVGLAVAAIPEGLPAVLTIALAIGVRRMALHRAIIRRLPAVEVLGAVSVICSDKTGTFTRNEMTVRSLITARHGYAVAGMGYDPAIEDGAEAFSGDLASDEPALELVRAAALCSDAETRDTAKGWVVDGDPMEGALVTLAHKAGIDPVLLRKQVPRTDEIPFDTQHKFMATLHHDHDGRAFVLIKGAPETVLAMCVDASGARLDASAWHRRVEAIAAEGQRVLGFATLSVAAGTRELSFETARAGARFLGLIGFIDPPRPDAVDAVAQCLAAGVRVVMITGDHAATAREIGRQLGLAAEPVVMTGAEVAALDGDGLAAAVERVQVFARTTPEDKLRIVEALQRDGAVVAMTGDGVNDAPALERADIGVAMGVKGTEAAKEAAEMVLADDNFASIVEAVRAGRTVYDNIVKVIAWTLPTNAAEAMIIVAALLFGLPMPVTPVQVLWINTVTAVALGLTLAFEPTEPGVMTHRPRPPGQPLIGGLVIWRIALVSTLFVLGSFWLYLWVEGQGRPVEEARTVVVNAIVVMEIFYLFAVRYVHGSSVTFQGVVGTPAVLAGVGATAAAQAVFTWWPPAQAVFGSRPIGLDDCIAIMGVGVAMLAVIEIDKAAWRRFGARVG